LKNGVVNADTLSAPAPSTSQVLSYDGTGLAWATPSGSGSVPDASSGTKGLVQLTGDLGGTAASPTVPGLSGKESTITAGTTSQYYRGDKSWQTLNKVAVGLSNVDDISDANKPISDATATALSGKANTSHSHVATDIASGTIAAARLPSATSGALGAIQLTGDLGGTAASPTVPGLSGKVTGLNGVTAVWSGTQSEYDVLGSHTATVLYFITD
jgi:hypothetical protein